MGKINSLSNLFFLFIVRMKLIMSEASYLLSYNIGFIVLFSLSLFFGIQFVCFHSIRFVIVANLCS